MIRPVLMAATVIALFSSVVIAADEHVHIVHVNEVPWAPAPDSLPAGAEFALIAGDPIKPGPFTFRLKVPAGYIVMPHTHPAAEYITVISGRLHHGTGDILQKESGVAMAAGDFAYLPAQMSHSVWTTDSPAVIQVNGTGPFTISYINPKDDPRKR